MSKALVVGGSNGIGISLVCQLIKKGYEKVFVVDKQEISKDCLTTDILNSFEEKVTFYKLDLITGDYSILEEIEDINTLFITAGFGRVCHFEDLDNVEIEQLIKCNELAAIKIIKHYYPQIKSNKDFYCGVMGSISGHIASPLFSVYGASKAGLCAFIENINCELVSVKCSNRILDISPGSINGTSFNGQQNDISALNDLANEIIEKVLSREVLFIPQYDEIYKSVIERYDTDPLQYGIDSYNYKIANNRLKTESKTVIGYLSGTFDLFHIGHLNLLRRAKEKCDYLIVGVHQSGSWKGKETFIPFEERLEIVQSIKYVDKAVVSCLEDSEAYDKYHYNKLFVGSDYKGSERFLKYEEYFKDKNVEIVYFPYTKGTSSTQLREKLKK